MSKKLLCFVMAVLVAASFTLTACNNKGDKSDLGAVNISYYDETSFVGNSVTSVMNDKLFRRNEFDLAIADPSVIQITDVTSDDYGKFYLYGTVGASASLVSFVSDDLTNWDYAGIGYIADTSTELGQVTETLVWATEVVYDDSDGYYYAFFSASENGERIYLSYCARSESPSGPFEIVSNAQNENRHTQYSAKTGDKYSLLNYDKLTEWFINIGGSVSSTYDNHLRTIDFHPFVDPVTSKKYLYFKIQEAYKAKDVIVGVEMETWIKPKYETLTLLAVASYTDTSCTKFNEYEREAKTNEGAFVNYKNGVYYLTFSPFGYADARYSVLQAYSKHPLGWTNGVQPTDSKGDFRKLEPEEGGLLVSTDIGNRYGVYATGHHALIDIEGKTYVLYHGYQTNDFAGDVRYLMVDEVKWLNIKDKNGEDLQVMYVNGPTTNIMPNFEFASDYTNLALDATVTATNLDEDSSAKWLNDDLYKIGTLSNLSFTNKYVQDAVFTDTTKITIDLGDYKTVRALMIYNSNDYETAFQGVKKVSMDCKLASGATFTAVINDLKFDMANNLNPEYEQINEILPGAAAIAEFDEMLVKSITITVEKPADNDELAISEIVVLGKNDDSAKATATSVDTYKDGYSPETSEKIDGMDYTVNDGITLDGKLDESIYDNQRWAEYRTRNSGNDYKILMTSYLGESGVYFAFKVYDPSVYDNPRTAVMNCSSIELYLSRSDAKTISNNAFCCTVTAGGRYVFRKYLNSGFSSWFFDEKAPYAAVQLEGELNKENGASYYTIEMYMDYSHLGLTEKPESVAASLLLNAQYSKKCNYNNRYHVRFGENYGITWKNNVPSTWTTWGENGLINLVDSEVYE